MNTQNIRTLSVSALIAASGMASTVQAADWAAAVNGNWNDVANWSPADIPNSIGEDANLGLAGVYTVFVTNNFSIGALNITNADAIASLGSNSLTLSGAMLNQGTFIVNDNGNTLNSLLRFDADTMLMGSGSVMLNGTGSTNDATIGANGGFTLTHAFGHTIHGSGEIVGSMVNSGLIIGDMPGAPGLSNNGNIVQTATGMFGADTGDARLFSGSSITGGELFTINGGKIVVNSGAPSIGDILNSGDIDVPGGSFTLAISDAVTNNGTITLNSTDQIFNATLRFDASISITGNGNVLMNTSGNSNDALVLAPDGITGTIGSNQTVEGSGQITGAAPTGNIHNTGVINGNDASGAALIPFGNHTGTGTYRSDDGILGLGSGVVMNGGTFETSGTGIVDTISSPVSIAGMVNNGQMGIRGQGHFLSLIGPLTNNGDILINSTNQVFNAHLTADVTVTISGTGTTTMQSPSNTGDANIRATDGFTMTFGSGQTVQGAGLVEGRGATGTIHNNGTFIGNDPVLPLEMRGNHTGTGTYRADNGVLGLAGGVTMDGGTFDSSGTGSVEALSGTITISNIANNGQMGIMGQGATVDMLTNFTNNGTININSNNAIFNATLQASADLTIDGAGTITMQSPSNTGDARILPNGFALTIGSGQTITGSGELDGTMTVEGTIDPDGAPLRHIDADQMTLTGTSTIIADLGGLLGGEFDRILLSGSDTLDLGGA
ncbi:MAG: hypothetical protein JKY96_04110, partial [Phycisphaerales bacterium]|nr:hypothetical protein [Phycisphaerales bacterium]